MANIVHQLHTPPNIHEQTIFITGGNNQLLTAHRCGSYGGVLKVKAVLFGSEIQEVTLSFSGAMASCLSAMGW